jgi:hypothetical protein
MPSPILQTPLHKLNSDRKSNGKSAKHCQRSLHQVLKRCTATGESASGGWTGGPMEVAWSASYIPINTQVRLLDRWHRVTKADYMMQIPFCASAARQFKS